jgi:hypothetical protein
MTGLGIRSARADARRQVAASYRPVLVPFQLSGEQLRFRGGTIDAFRGPQISENPTDRTDLPTYSAAFLPVMNVGTGPALNARGTFTGPRGTGNTEDPTEAIAAGERGVVAFENTSGPSLQYTGNDASVSAVLRVRRRRRHDLSDRGVVRYRTQCVSVDARGPVGAVAGSARGTLPAVRRRVGRGSPAGVGDPGVVSARIRGVRPLARRRRVRGRCAS